MIENQLKIIQLENILTTNERFSESINLEKLNQQLQKILNNNDKIDSDKYIIKY